MATQTTEEITVLVAQGDAVTLTDNRTGQVAFVGSVEGKKEIQFGIILDKRFTGDTNGAVNNVCYFKATNNRGVFVTLSQIKKSKCMISFKTTHNAIGVDTNIIYDTYILYT